MADTKAKFYHILEILWDTDEEHPKTAAQIGELLDARYDIAAERKSICRDINILRDECGFNIHLSADNKAGFYLASRPFEDWELKFLMDAVLSSRALSETDARELVNKLKRQGSQTSRELLAAITPLPPKPEAEKHLGKVKYGIDTVLKAIRANRQIAFTYLTFDTDKQPTPRRKEAYQVSPYALVRKGDFYYLICNYNKYDNLSFYRLDRMKRIALLPDKRKPLRAFVGTHERAGLSDFVHRALYSFTGDPVELRLEIPTYEVSDLIDAFGNEVTIHKTDEDACEARMTVQDGPGLYFWLLQRADNVKVLSPASVRDHLVELLKTMLAQYEALTDAPLKNKEANHG